MKLKTIEMNGKTYAEVLDGKPVYVGDDGKDLSMDIEALTGKVTHLTAEATNAFKARDEVKAALRKFDGITDVAAAVSALDIVSKLDQKKLIDAGEVDKVRVQIEKGYTEKLTAAETRTKVLEDQLRNEIIGGRFARSSMIVGEKAKLAIPADLVEAKFGSNFKIEDGKVVAYDSHNNKIFSKERLGELADFDEALATLVEQYPHRDSILKAAAGSGGGAGGNQQGGNNGKAMTRTAFNALNPAQQGVHMAAGGAVVEG